MEAYELRLKDNNDRIHKRRVFASSFENAKSRIPKNARIMGGRKVQPDDLLAAEVKKIAENVYAERRMINRKQVMLSEETTVDSIVFKNKGDGIRKRENIEKYKTIKEYLK